MKLDEILAAAGANKKPKRIGRGEGSGRGKTSGRGHKGYGQRAGAKSKFGYEGGQNPMLRRIPKRGFNNYNYAREVEIVNVCDLQRSFEDGQTVTAEALAEKGLIGRTDVPVKLLGKGEISCKLTVKVNLASDAGVQKVQAAGGTVELVS